MLVLTAPITTAALCSSCGAASPPSTTSLGPSLTSFGATDSAWNAHHTADSRFAAGAAYDQDSSLPPVNGHTGARYYAVQHSGGRVLGYYMAFPPGTPITAARGAALREFPPDTVVLWFAIRPTCAQEEVTSRTLGTALGATADQVLVEFDTSLLGGSATYQGRVQPIIATAAL